ncbi:hypothetical protein [Ensifer sp. YR511]|uniref:hypothetical protein n=1 Tax=Ensifer sp. YR511 TaxID=1855294 RepID=UPI00088A05CB|nr:hypothetical protein [Ensifer sp. YR511]SDN74409.1 hypothetical protein SAMN05216328_13548 [Ensifer sp. YR511]
MKTKEELQTFSDGLNNNLLFHEGVVGAYMIWSAGDDVPLAEKLLGFSTRLFAVTGFVASIGTGYMMEGGYGAVKGSITASAGLLAGLATGAWASSVMTGPFGMMAGVGLGMLAGMAAGNVTGSFIDSIYKDGIGGPSLQPVGRSSARAAGDLGLTLRGYETNTLDVLGEMGTFQSFAPSPTVQGSRPQQPWTAGGHWFDLDFDLSDPYSKPGGPYFGGHIHSGYTGPRTGYDTPSEKIRPVDRLALPTTPLDVQTAEPTSTPPQPSMVEPYILDPTTVPLPNPPVQPYMLDPIRPMAIDPAAPLVAQLGPLGSFSPVDLRPNLVVATPRPDQLGTGSTGGGGGNPARGGTSVGGSGGSTSEDRNDRGSNGYGAGNYGGASNSGSKGSGSLGSSSARGGGSSSGEYSRTPSEGPTPNARPDRSFPGKDKDDRDVGRTPTSRPERSFPGKDKDDRDFGRVSSETYSASGSGRGSAATGAGSSTRTRTDFREPPTRGGGWVGAPVIMDLTGNGLDITPLGSSSKFVETNGDGYERRTAWAGDGNGVLVIDLGGDGKITEEKEFAFAQWDPSASGDLAALKSVFDTNGNGKLDAGDARWNEFKVMVGDQLVSLASLGIASIDLTPTGTGRVFSDGSAITGTTTFTRTDGTTGAVGDAVLAGDATGYIIKRSSVTNADGSTTTDISGFTKAGAVVFRELVTISADGLSTTTRYDDDGNGTFDRSQTSILTIGADGTRTRAVSDYRADGSLSGRTTTITASDKRTVTTLSDDDGDGITDERQVFAANADGSTSTTVEVLSASGAILKRAVIAASADGLTKVTNTDSTGAGTFDLVRTEVTVIGADGNRTKTITSTAADGTVLARSVEAISANGRAQSIDLDHAGNGRFDERRSVATDLAADGAVTTTAHVRNEDGSLRSKTITTNSASGLSKVVSADLTGDDVIDRVSSNVTSVAADGTWTETIEERSGDGSLLSRRVTTKSADRTNTTISDDKDGDGSADETATIAVAPDGSATTTITTLAPNGGVVTRTSKAVSADGLSGGYQSDCALDGYDFGHWFVDNDSHGSRRRRCRR